MSKSQELYLLVSLSMSQLCSLTLSLSEDDCHYFQYLTNKIQSCPEVYCFQINDQNKIFAPVAMDTFYRKAFLFNTPKSDLYSAIHLYQYLMRKQVDDKQDDSFQDIEYSTQIEMIDEKLISACLYLICLHYHDKYRLKNVEQLIEKRRVTEILKVIKFKINNPSFLTLIQNFIDIFKRSSIKTNISIKNRIQQIIKAINDISDQQIQLFNFLTVHPIQLASSIILESMQKNNAYIDCNISDILSGKITTFTICFTQNKFYCQPKYEQQLLKYDHNLQKTSSPDQIVYYSKLQTNFQQSFAYKSHQ